MKLQMDLRWDAFLVSQDFESFKKETVTPIFFKPEVSTDVVKSFRVIEKLLIHSYFEYEFWDVAANKALQTFEMALKIRFRELTGNDWSKNKNLKELIQWFSDGTYFEVLNEHFLEKIRDIRNYYSHPVQYGFGGPMVRQWVEHPMDLINDLYEDPQLRLARHQYAINLTNRFQTLLKEGAILEMGEERTIIQHLGVIFIDNKENPIISYLILIPLFEPSEYYDKPYDPNKKLYYEIATKDITFVNDNSCVITLFDSPNNISLVSLLDNSDKELYEDWKQRFKLDQKFFAMESQLRSMMSDCFAQFRRQFHKK